MSLLLLFSGSGTPFTLPNLTWYSQDDAPRIKRSFRSRPQDDFIAVPTSISLGWFISADKVVVGKRRRSFTDTAEAITPPVIIATAIGYDWYTDANKVPVRKRVRSFSDTTFQVITPTTTFGWFESFPQTRVRKVRKFFDEIFVAQPIAAVVIPGYAWFVQYPRPVQFFKKSTIALRSNAASAYGLITAPVVVPPTTPGTVSDLYHRPGTQKTKFWREVYAQGIRRGPPNVAGRIRR